MDIANDDAFMVASSKELGNFFDWKRFGAGLLVLSLTLLTWLLPSFHLLISFAMGILFGSWGLLQMLSSWRVRMEYQMEPSYKVEGFHPHVRFSDLPKVGLWGCLPLFLWVAIQVIFLFRQVG